MIFTLASNLRPGDEVYLGASVSSVLVTEVTRIGAKLRIATNDGCVDVDPGQRIRVR